MTLLCCLHAAWPVIDILHTGPKQHAAFLLGCWLLSCRYQRYLEGVLEVADEYQEVQDLLLRHATLQATNDDLRAHQQRCSKEAEDIRTALQVYVKQQTDVILDLNNTLAKLKKQLEQQEEQAGVLVSREDWIRVVLWAIEVTP